MKKISLVGLAGVIVVLSAMASPAATTLAATQATLSNLQAQSLTFGPASSTEDSSAMSLLQPASLSSGGDQNSLSTSPSLTKQDILAEADNSPAPGGTSWLAITLFSLLGIAIIIAAYILGKFLARHRLALGESDNH